MRSLALLALAVLTGCASSYSYRLDLDQADGRQRLTERGADQRATVRVIGRPGAQAQALSVRADSTSWVDPATGAAHTVATDQLRSISFAGSRKTPLLSLAVGAVAGAAAGTLLGAISYDLPHGPIDSQGNAIAFGAAAGGIVGALTGGAMGSDGQSSELFLVRARPAGR